MNWKQLEEEGFMKEDVIHHSEEVISCIERLQNENDDIMVKNEPEDIPDISEFTISKRIQVYRIHINVM